MPEGDTVYLAAQRLHSALTGHRLLRADFRVPRFATVDVTGTRVESVASYGKHLFLRLDDARTIHTHFRMDGAWHLYRHGERWRGPDWQVRAVLETDAYVAVGFRLPVLEVVAAAAERAIVDGLGPDPLSDRWDAAEALRRLEAAGPRTISEALLDQRVMAGPGNVYRCEICFLRGLDPWTPVDAVPDPAGVVRLVKRLFDANRGRADHVTTGDTRRGRQHWVYGRAGHPCRRCGTLVRKHDATPGPDGERVTYWCPSCQPPRSGPNREHLEGHR